MITFVNGTKIQVIPPLLDNKLITDFKVKANLFNDFLNQQWNAVDIPSSVPENISSETEKRLSTFEVCNNNIVKFIRLLDPDKAYSLDGISICMLRLCAISLTEPLQIFYKNWVMNAFLKCGRKLTFFLFRKGD